MKKILRLFTKQTVWIVNIIAVILLVCTKLIPFINPNDFWAMGILGLVTPFVAGANILFIILWMLFAKWRRLLLSAIAIVLCWNIFSVGIAGNAWETNTETQNDTTHFSVMSYNVRLMDYYNWSGNKNTRQQMLDFIKQKNASVLCLQEFFSSEDSSGIQNVKAIASNCGYKYYSANKNFITKRGFFGDIIFSKYPIVNERSIQLDASLLTHRFQYADVVWRLDTYRIFNLHMQSVKFDQQEIALLDNKKVNTKSNTKKIAFQKNSQYAQSKIIIKKLKTSFAKRGLQANVIAKEIQKTKLPSIVCGDLNDIPSSYTYFTVRGSMNDAFLDKGFGLGRTYNGISPVLRIDNIFYNASNVCIKSFHNFDVSYSDHYPIMMVIQKK